MMDERDCPVCGIKWFDRKNRDAHFFEEHFEDMGGVISNAEDPNEYDHYVCWCGVEGERVDIRQHFQSCGGLHAHYHATILGVKP